jgi:DNA topoisomerase I
VQYGAKKYASLKKEDDPYTVTLERALEIIREKQTIEANRIIKEFGDAGIQVLNGRYGPYITDGKKNGKIPKDREPASLTLEECQALIAAAPERGANRWGRKTAARTTTDAASEAAPSKTAARKKAAAVKKAAGAEEKGSGCRSARRPPRKRRFCLSHPGMSSTETPSTSVVIAYLRDLHDRITDCTATCRRQCRLSVATRGNVPKAAAANHASCATAPCSSRPASISRT